ncbi:uncharacterized protein LOC105684173 isoform X1 [Athalia rosae]|uniref:uncharacterized protein LOC105684173 isoform X1 n=1 Tax=Athalia rosae TaxID=37344 RepID=UPI00203405B3|nr:uncharacterized protein LOC105684173 isoform X1 [Athalia rosae]
MMPWRDRCKSSRLKKSKKDPKGHRSLAELALAFFSKVDRYRSRMKLPRDPPCRCAACWSESLPHSQIHRKNCFSSRHSSSPASSCSGALSFSSSGTAKSFQSEPPLTSSRHRHTVTRDIGKPSDQRSPIPFIFGSRDTEFEAHKDHRRKHEGYSSARVTDKMIVPITTNNNDNLESGHSVLRERDNRLQDYPKDRIGYHSKWDKKEDSVRVHKNDKAVDGGCCFTCSSSENCSGGKVAQNVTGASNLQRKKFHDAATGNVVNYPRKIFEDKAVGDEKEILRHDFSKPFNRESENNANILHNNSHTRVVNKDHGLRHVYYEKGSSNNSRENSRERRARDLDGKLTIDRNMKGAHNRHDPDHSLERSTSSNTCRENVRDKVIDKQYDDAKDRVRENRSKVISKDKIKSKKYDRCEAIGSTDSTISCEVYQDHRRKPRKKGSDCSKMSFVMADKPLDRPTAVLERSVASGTSHDSISSHSRSNAHTSRNK